MPSNPSVDVTGGPAPTARSTDVFGPGAQLARDGLDTDEERGESGDGPEHPEGDGLGVDGSLGLGFDLRGDVDLER